MPLLAVAGKGWTCCFLLPAAACSRCAGSGGAAGCCPVSILYMLPLAAVGCCWLRLAAVGCCWLLLAAVGCCWLLSAAVGCCWLLLLSFEQQPSIIHERIFSGLRQLHERSEGSDLDVVPSRLRDKPGCSTPLDGLFSERASPRSPLPTLPGASSAGASSAVVVAS